MSSDNQLLTGIGNESDVFISTRKRAIRRYHWVAIAMLISAVLSIIVGIVILVEGKDGKFPIKSGSSIWSGIVALVCASFGLVLRFTKSDWFTENDRKNQRYSVVVFAGFTTISSFISLVNLVFTIWGAVVCGKHFFGKCGGRVAIETAMNIISCLLSVTNITVCVISLILFYHYRKAFQFYTNSDLRENRRRLLYQHQMATQPQQCPEIYSGYGTNFPSAPPPYTEKQLNE